MNTDPISAVPPYDNPQLMDRIKKELVDVNYYDDVSYNIRSKSRWKFIGDACEALSKLVMGSSTILSFAAGSYDYQTLSFIAGSLGVGALVLGGLSSYAMRESRERTDQVNKLLENLGISKIPDIVIDSAGDIQV